MASFGLCKGLRPGAIICSGEKLSTPSAGKASTREMMSGASVPLKVTHDFFASVFMDEPLLLMALQAKACL